MTGKGKEKKGEDKKKREVDESQLRREIRALLRTEDTEDSVPKMPIEQKALHAEDIRIGGIEGGASHSTLVILDGRGNEIAEVHGPATNPLLLGMGEATARINAMIEQGKKQMKIPASTPLSCVGLSLSGCEDESTKQIVQETLLEKYPNTSQNYVITSDTLGSLRTALQTGGIVLISGTGSNALLINGDGESFRCGGWGYMMGDEGSAYWIAQRACKYVFDELDEFEKAPHEICYVWPAMKNYFQVDDRNAMLPYLYNNFDKSHLAMFTKHLALGCEKDDPLCLHLFQEAGRLLAAHVVTLSTKAHNELKLAPGGLKVVCVGSVWKSWRFMKKGFTDRIHRSKTVDELSLLRLKNSSALGACYIAAEKIEQPFVKPYDKNAEVFYHYKRTNYPDCSVKISELTQMNQSSSDSCTN